MRKTIKYTVSVKPGAKLSQVIQISETELRADVKAPAHDGKANKELIHILAKFLKIPQSTITIKQGISGRKKLIEVV